MDTADDGFVVDQHDQPDRQGFYKGHLDQDDDKLCLLKVVDGLETARSEMVAGRKCAGLGASHSDLQEAWTESTLTAMRTHVLAPMRVVDTPSTKGILMPWIGPFLDVPSGGLPVLRVLRIARDVATGIGNCHSHRHVHLDINKDNIVINEKTKAAVIMDFSLSRFLPCNGCAATATDGQATHMPPEQTGLTNETSDFRSDLYSLGVTMFHLLTGYLPFEPTQSRGDLMHAHASEEPQSLSRKVPSVVRNMVTKLLAKTKSERYSSARSLVDDLDTIIRVQCAGLDNMMLNADPHYVELQPLKKLYGASDKVQAVVSSFEAASDGALSSSLLRTLHGTSGSGKSSLITAAQQVLLEREDYSVLVCSGKFLQQNGTPYQGIAACFTDLIRQLKDLPNAQKKRIYRILKNEKSLMVHASQLGVLCRDFLNLAMELTGEDEVPLSPASPEKQHARFTAAFEFILEVFYKKAWLPIVLFIDDVQWADSCSLLFLKSMLLLVELPVLIYWSYRDEAVGDDHEVRKILNSLAKEKDLVNVEEMAMEPWNTNDIVQVILGLFGVDDGSQGSAKPAPLCYGGAELTLLAQFLRDNSQGNPFFTIVLARKLVDDEVLAYSWSSRRWEWSMAALGDTSYGGSVTDLLLAGLGQLPTVDRRVLLALAMAGSHVRLGLLCDILPQVITADEIASMHLADKDKKATSAGVHVLWPLIDTGFVTVSLPVGVDSMVQFTHDQIEEAALSLFSAEERLRIQIVVAKSMFLLLSIPVLSDASAFEAGSVPEPISAEKIASLVLPANVRLTMIAVDHLLAQQCILEHDIARRVLAHYAYLCGKSSLGLLAFERAAGYFASALSLEDGLKLEETSPLLNRNRLWLLRLDLATALRLSESFDKATGLYEDCLAATTDPYQSLLAYDGLSSIAVEKHEYERAIANGVAAASRMGVEIDVDTSVVVAKEFIVSHVLARMADASRLSDAIPNVKLDSTIQLLDLLMDRVVACARQAGRPVLRALVPAKMVELALTRGHSTPGTFNFLAMLGYNMAAVFRMRAEGFEVAVGGGIERFRQCMGDATSVLDASRLINAARAQQWGESLDPALEYLTQAFSKASLLGCIGEAALARVLYISCCFQSAVPLRRILDLVREGMPYIRKTLLEDMIVSMDSFNLSSRLMVGGSGKPTEAELQALEDHAEKSSSLGKANCYVWMMLAYHMVGRDEDAIRMMDLVVPDLLEEALDSPPLLEYHWIAPLVRSRRLRKETDPEKQKADFDLIKKSEKLLFAFNRASPKLWNSKRMLVRAHRLQAATIRGCNDERSDLSDTLIAFDQTAGLAESDGLIHIAALAFTGAGEACAFHEPPLRYPAAAYDMSARSLLVEWGAAAASKQIQVDDKTEMRMAISQAVPTYSSSNSSGDEVLQLWEKTQQGNPVADALSDISSQKTPEKVLTSLMESLEAVGGAEYVVLVQKSPEADKVAVNCLTPIPALLGHEVKGSRRDCVSVLRSRALDGGKEPLEVIARCLSTGEVMVFEDVERCLETEELSSPYWADKGVASAAVFPIKDEAELVAVVYVENTVTPCAFRKVDNSALTRLAHQAAISYRTAMILQQTAIERNDSTEALKVLQAESLSTGQFVPEAFLSRVGKTGGTVRKGDAVETVLTVVTIEVQSFASIDESMSAAGVFEYLNYVLNLVSPFITAKRGTVLKLSGDVFIAIFTSASDAIQSALDIQQIIRDVRAEGRKRRSKSGVEWPPVELGIGIDTGPTMLGCMGDSARLEATVLGTTVARSVKAASLTTYMGVAVLTTAASMQAHIEDVGDDATPCRLVGKIKLQGNSGGVQLLQPLEDPNALRRRGEADRARLVTNAISLRNRFTHAFHLYGSGRYNEANLEFRKLQERSPNDKPVMVLEQRSRKRAVRAGQPILAM